MGEKRQQKHADIWVISKSRYIDFDLGRILKGGRTQSVTSYEISDLARYLLNPNSIKVKKRLVGCEIHNHPSQSFLERIMGRLRPRARHARQAQPETLMADAEKTPPPLKDARLASHFNLIDEHLRPYTSIIKRLSGLEKRNVADIIGICRDIGGNVSPLNLAGNLDEKIVYLSTYMLSDVDVIMEKACISKGLFELTGFDFTNHDPLKKYRCIKFRVDGRQTACVLSSDGRVDFWVGDPHLIYYLQLLAELIQADAQLNEALALCRAGKATPSKLFFNPQLDIDYLRADPPRIYQSVFKQYRIDSRKQQDVQNTLNQQQLGVSFNYVPADRACDDRPTIHLSVMHNLKALEPIKDALPQVYAAIHKRAYFTEIGRFYLLDSIKGCRDDRGV